MNKSVNKGGLSCNKSMNIMFITFMYYRSKVFNNCTCDEGTLSRGFYSLKCTKTFENCAEVNDSLNIHRLEFNSNLCKAKKNMGVYVANGHISANIGTVAWSTASVKCQCCTTLDTKQWETQKLCLMVEKDTDKLISDSDKTNAKNKSCLEKKENPFVSKENVMLLVECLINTTESPSIDLMTKAISYQPLSILV